MSRSIASHTDDGRAREGDLGHPVHPRARRPATRRVSASPGIDPRVSRGRVGANDGDRWVSNEVS